VIGDIGASGSLVVGQEFDVPVSLVHQAVAPVQLPYVVSLVLIV